MAAPPRGALIVVEGLDRVGKTTQVACLVERLQRAGHSAERIKFPGLPLPSAIPRPLCASSDTPMADRSTRTGQQINAYLTSFDPTSSQHSDHVIHLLFATNRWEALPALEARLAAGTTLVVDRYSFSGAAYSAAKGVAHLDLDWAWNPEVGLPKPDVVVFLAAKERAAVEGREGWGEERYERREMQERVRECFEELWGRVRGVRVERVDAGRSIEEVEADIWKSVEVVVEGRARRGPLEPLGPLAPKT